MKFFLIGIGWLSVAAALGASGALRHLRPPAPQIILFVLTALLLFAWRRSQEFRAWVDALDLRALLALHLTRFVGAYFLLLYQRGELPYDFAVRGGWGDIIVASSAALLLILATAVPLPRFVVLAWNVFASIDILLVIASAAKNALRDPASMAPLLRLPLSLLVTFLVPLLCASHVAIFARSPGRARAIKH